MTGLLNVIERVSCSQDTSQTAIIQVSFDGLLAARVVYADCAVTNRAYPRSCAPTYIARLQTAPTIPLGAGCAVAYRAYIARLQTAPTIPLGADCAVTNRAYIARLQTAPTIAWLHTAPTLALVIRLRGCKPRLHCAVANRAYPRSCAPVARLQTAPTLALVHCIVPNCRRGF